MDLGLSGLNSGILLSPSSASANESVFFALVFGAFPPTFLTVEVPAFGDKLFRPAFLVLELPAAVTGAAQLRRYVPLQQRVGKNCLITNQKLAKVNQKVSTQQYTYSGMAKKNSPSLGASCGRAKSTNGKPSKLGPRNKLKEQKRFIKQQQLQYNTITDVTHATNLGTFVLPFDFLLAFDWLPFGETTVGTAPEPLENPEWKITACNYQMDHSATQNGDDVTNGTNLDTEVFFAFLGGELSSGSGILRLSPGLSVLRRFATETSKYVDMDSNVGEG